MPKKESKSATNISRSAALLYYGSAIIIMIGLAILFTWPLAPNISSSIISQSDFTDGPFFIWNLWWVKKALLSLENPFISNYVYFPANSNLALHTLTLTSGLIYLPLSLIFSGITSLNLIQLMSIVASGLGMILLLNYILKPSTFLQRIPSFVGALLFALSPYLFSHLMAGHYNLSMIWPIPFLILFFLKIINEGKLINALMLGILASALGYLDLQLLFFTAFIFIPLIIGEVLAKRREFFREKIILNLVISLLTFLFLFLLPYGLLMRDFLGSSEPMSTYNNGDIAILFGPNPLNPVFGNANLSLVLDMIGSYRENIISLSFVGLFSALAGIVLFARQFFKEKVIFVLSFLIGVSLALGPNLQNKTLVQEQIRLPYFYLQDLPFFNWGLVPTRFILIAYFALAVLATIGVFSFVKYLESKHLKFSAIVFVIIISIGVLVESYSGKMLIDPLIDYPQLTAIASEEGDFTVLPYNAGQRDSYLQVQHQKRVVTGFLGRRIHDYYLAQYGDVYPINRLDKGRAYELDTNDTEQEIKSTLSRYKIKYIIVEKNFKDRDELKALDNYLGIVKIKKSFDSDTLAIYRVY